eukprot:29974-Pelagococcus_subviridis.AAC.1
MRSAGMRSEGASERETAPLTGRGRRRRRAPGAEAHLVLVRVPLRRRELIRHERRVASPSRRGRARGGSGARPRARVRGVLCEI